MTYIISGCFEWIGFHLTEAFLNAGHTVIGIDKEWNEQKDWLSLYVGRNASFHLVDSIHEVKKKTDEEVILIHIEERVTGEDPNLSIKDEWTIKTRDDDTEKSSVIYASEVYGPWMTELIKPTSEEALYIDDFVSAIQDIIEQKVEGNWIEVKPSSGGSKGHHQDTWYVKESMDVQEGWKKVMDHEEKFSIYYKL
ncbi:hypothetical protein N780_03385 [Pontibacillus chungwhensis BH030062]|uniref:NAD-dependent epimerase/dehydratase domain-containing protein n=1 Tax=Pontibacillus chungwhensis BH030062 TaxID=1385513 RepID=A0A0A2UR90_9BACI|nr:hypothetical protein [Pontibacillus chungwhensis]KGP90802.1 hypothetical protein N780_03385 [Pontibacillus chungwhensis BH030062]